MTKDHVVEAAPLRDHPLEDVNHVGIAVDVNARRQVQGVKVYHGCRQRRASSFPSRLKHLRVLGGGVQHVEVLAAVHGQALSPHQVSQLGAQVSIALDELAVRLELLYTPREGLGDVDQPRVVDGDVRREAELARLAPRAPEAPQFLAAAAVEDITQWCLRSVT